jgi:geranylgeranyl diphosphate synthase type I
MDLAHFISQFSPTFNAHLQERIMRYKNTFPEPIVEELIDHLLPLLSGGKRVRPYIISLGAQTTKGDSSMATKLGIAIELFHGFALIHDDIIDKAKTRRGIPTIETKAKEQFQKEKERDHLALSQALLVGDLVYAWSMELLREAPIACHETFFSMIDEVVTGQMIDVGCMKQETVTQETILKKIDLKTGSYTFVRPLQLGMHIAGATENELASAKDIGIALGRAFQMQDDFFDVTAQEEEIKKDSMRDIEQGEQTLITHYVFQKGNAEQQKILRTSLGKKLSNEEKETLRKVLQNSGALHFATREINHAFAEARTALMHAPFHDDIKQEWETLIALLESRRV